jgi:hypothetical protein
MGNYPRSGPPFKEKGVVMGRRRGLKLKEAEVAYNRDFNAAFIQLVVTGGAQAALFIWRVRKKRSRKSIQQRTNFMNMSPTST